MTKKDLINTEIYKNELATLHILEGVLGNIQVKPLENGAVELHFPNLPPQDSLVEMLKFRASTLKNVVTNSLFEMTEKKVVNNEQPKIENKTDI